MVAALGETDKLNWIGGGGGDVLLPPPLPPQDAHNKTSARTKPGNNADRNAPDGRRLRKSIEQDPREYPIEIGAD